MRTFETQFSACRLGQVHHVADDGVIGIPTDVTVYFNTENEAKSGYCSTPVIVYAVGMQYERIGTASDAEIVASMLARGYIVAVLDYLDDARAALPRLDFSLQKMRSRIQDGEFFEGRLPAGSYRNSFVVPEGYDVSLSNVYYELDKYTVDGTLDKIVETWNNDFRGTKGENVIKWTAPDGTRKSVATAFDGTEPEWLGADGAPDPDGEYIKVKYTKAHTVLDCVKRDGTPIDMKLYMHLIYPTAPKKPAPVMCLASSSEHLASGAATLDRPHLIGATLRGYVGVMFDYGYVPMARCDHYGYFDGYPMKGYVTGDNWTYSLHHYNDKLIDSAAIRYVRYIALDNPAFHFDTDHIGVFGASKGGCFAHLGEEHPERMLPMKVFNAHHGEERLVGTNPNAFAWIHAAEEQPWQTYKGKPLPSNVQFGYPSVGCNDNVGSFSNEHSATFITCNRGCKTGFASSPALVHVCRALNIPAVWFEVEQGHTLASAVDVHHGVSSYDAFFSFAGHVLKGEAARVLYAEPEKGEIHVKFAGVVPKTSAERITVTAAGRCLPFTVSSLFGDTEWILTPTETVKAGKLTLTIPQDLKDAKGNVLGEVFTKEMTVDTDIVPPSGHERTKTLVRIPALDDFVAGSMVRMIETIAPDGEPALAITEPFVVTNHAPERYYMSRCELMQNSTLIKEGALDAEDLGRTFRISMRIYDSESRLVTVALSGCLNPAEKFNDYRRPVYNVRTRAGEWVDFSFDYTVYEPEHGEFGKVQSVFSITAPLFGNAHRPIYFKDFKVEEFV